MLLLDSFMTDKVVDAGLLLLKIKYNKEDVIFYPTSTMSIIGTEAMQIKKGSKFVAVLPR